MKPKQTMIVLFLIILLFARCDTTEPPQSKASLTLTLEDVSCTEAWLTLRTEELTLPAELVLKQYNPSGDSFTQILLLSTKDSLLYIDSLLPKQTYVFQVSSIKYQVSSNKANATTLDTTSHNFTWQTWTFGEHSSSVLYDVAIIDENNIWAVGEIYMNDSLGQPDTTPFNAVCWNGISWEIMRIPTKTFSGTIVSSQIRTIFAFNDNNIWMFSIAGSYSHWNGNDWETEFVSERTGSGNKLWGTSSSDLYLVCNNGGISHYNGTSWTKIESGTALNINDIWGDYNEKTGEWEILAVASNKYFNEGNKLIMIDGSSSLKLNSNGLPWSLSSIWLKAGRLYFVAGDGLFSKKLLSDNKWIKDTLFVPIYKDRIRGHSFNDIIVSGSNGLISHFNGIGWKHYFNNEIPSFSGRLLSCYYFDKIIVAVGWKNTQSIIIIGKK